MKTNKSTVLILLCIHGGIVQFLIITTDSFLMQLSLLGVLILIGMTAWSLLKEKDAL